MAIIKSSKAAGSKGKNRAVAFMNWEIPLKSGKCYKSEKGFPIFQNPEYPNMSEDMLIKLAESHDGAVELTMKVTVRLATPKTEAPDVSEFLLA